MLIRLAKMAQRVYPVARFIPVRVDRGIPGPTVKQVLMKYYIILRIPSKNNSIRKMNKVENSTFLYAHNNWQ